MKNQTLLFGIIIIVILCSCMKHGGLYHGPDPDPEPDSEEKEAPLYIYPFEKEGHDFVAEITVKTKGNIDLEQLKVEMPHLKYNKSLLFILSQDDCTHSAYCYTWAAINGRPLSLKYYYDFRHYLKDDLPPDTYYFGKTLGSTDGAGNEVRFAFTTTLAPELNFMNIQTGVRPGYTNDYFRFFMKSGLIWENVIDMVNYGTGIAFHDVNTIDVNNLDSLMLHYNMAQDSIIKHLSGRGCKTLAEPNGNKNYVTAARLPDVPIQIMTAQTQTIKLYPFQVNTDLQGDLLNRSFFDINDIKKLISDQMELPREEREAICIGVHGTAGKDWVEFFLWLNDRYGKDGDDSIWFTSLEEYYEYNYYRTHGTIEKTIMDANTLKIKVSLPSEQYFYYPSVTLNLDNLTAKNIQSVSVNNAVQGLSYATYENKTMINIDCRKYLLEHATHFVEQYEQKPTEINQRDARYFTAMLKASSQKEALLKRIK